MGLPEEIYCAECGKKTDAHTRTKLNDGNHLCPACSQTVPEWLTESAGKISLEQFHKLRDYFYYSQNELSKLFKETHSYQKLHLDSKHMLFYYDLGLPDCRVIFELKNLDEFELEYKPGICKGGIIHRSVEGELLLTMQTSNPYTYTRETIAKDIKSKCKTNFSGTQVTYKNPSGMDEFLDFFRTAWFEATVGQDAEADE
ncbi:MAG: hypothetical protein PUC05_02455 [Firmicutes bacterium]|nr:hypothetical protein [Bacillota bacterium]